MRLLDRSVDPCGGDYTGAVLGLGDCVFCRCRGLVYAFRLEVPQVQLIFKDVVFSVVTQDFSHGPDFSAVH